MKILYLLNKSIITPDFAISLMQEGYDVDVLEDCECSYKIEDEYCMNAITKCVCEYYERTNTYYDYFMSFNFIPSAALVANKYGITYISWMYDVWQPALFSRVGKLNTNVIFFMDSEELETARSLGFDNAFLLPLAVNDIRLSKIEITEEDIAKYSCDVSFVGGIYSNTSINAYSQMREYLSVETKAGIDEIIDSSTGKWTDKAWFDRIKKIDFSAIPIVDSANRRGDCILNDAIYYTALGFARTLTEHDRRCVMNAVSQKYNTRLYTFGEVEGLSDKVKICGSVDYIAEMPKAFYCSKINLNISLRSIFSGIPLRAFDIMGSGGFLVSNRQKEFDMLFRDGIDYVAFDNVNDLIDKIGYYLHHEDERTRILVNGYNKVMEYHTYKKRLDYMFKILDRIEK